MNSMYIELLNGTTILLAINVYLVQSQLSTNTVILSSFVIKFCAEFCRFDMISQSKYNKQQS
jgi:hypothetical protein